jgi:hypothetical protein
MTPARVLVVILALILGATLAVGTFAAPRPARSDDDYIAIARSRPEVFKAGTPRQVTVQRGDPVIVDFVFDNARYVVFIDPRNDQVTGVERR